MTERLPFGRWLKQCRKTLDLTQEALAERVGCAVPTIRKFEAGTLRPSRQMAALLAERLELPSAERTAFLTAARTAPAPAAAAPLPALPADPRSPGRLLSDVPVPLTPLIGRVREVGEVCALLQQPDVRLVALTGPGGVGKTRLGLQVAAQLHDSFVDGVTCVTLAPVRNPTLVLSAIAQALRVTAAGGPTVLARLRAALQHQKRLVLLDNFEHVVSAAPLIAELLAVAPSLKILVTSRAVLHLSGEQEYVVPPLELPNRQHLPPIETLAHYEAVALFVTRARGVDLGFQLTEANAVAVTEICQRLDGLPLAIELAAARSKLLPPPALLVRLQQRLPLLTGGASDLPARQRTLRDTIDWSYQLLTPPEQRLFVRLAVFVAVWTLEAAEAICTPTGDLTSTVLEGLTALLDQSLIQRAGRQGDEASFVLLETIREYALERLEASGEAERMRERHAAYYLTLATRIEPELRYGALREVQVALLERQQGDLRASLDWALEHNQRDAAAHAAVVLCTLWWTRGRLAEGRIWLTQVLRPTEQRPSAAFAVALNLAGFMAASQEDITEAQVLLNQGLAIARMLDDQPMIATALTYLSHVEVVQEHYATAITLAEEGLMFARAAEHESSIAVALVCLGTAALLAGDYTRAAQCQEQSLAIAQEIDDRLAFVWALMYRGRTAQRQGEADRAETLIRESIVLLHGMGHTLGLTVCLEILAEVAGLRKQPERMVRLFGVAAVFRADLGIPAYRGERRAFERQLDDARAVLNGIAFDAAWTAGQSLTLEQAIADGLGEQSATPETPRGTL